MQARGSRELEARNYLEKHRIMELLNYLTSTLLFFRPGGWSPTAGERRGPEYSLNGLFCAGHWPEKPREYLISILERLRIAKVTGVAFPFFMDHSNIVSMFEMMDTSHKGTISFVQYREGLKTLGLLDEDEVLQDDGHVITLEKFRSEVNKRTEKIWSAF
uniref:EF-hand calcium binding domain 10 n=1 Tax=Mustela putorius furo TaxID=9669 RepID=M3Z3I1_MUSPF